MEKRNVPKLRFKGFEDEWKSEVLGRFIKERVEKTESNGEYPLYSLTIEEGVVPKSERYEREFLVKKDGNFKVVYKNDFVYNPMNLRFGALAVYKGDSPVGVSGYYNIFKFNNENSNFWINYLKTSRMMYLYNTIATGSLEEKKRVHYSQFKDLNLKIPSLEEQTKIATFLSNVDNIIEEQEGKVKDLEQYKKGMMQKIFKQQVRFKDENGEEYSEWEEKKLGECIVCLDNMRKPLNSTERQEMKGNIPYYGANGIVDYINDFIFDERLILLAEDGGNFDEFATRPIAQIITGKSWINNHAHVLKAKENYIDYIFYTLVHKDIRQYINGTSRAKLNKSDMLDIKIDIPCIEEQTKIANFLSNIDNIIEEEKKKLEDLKLWKKGLLQQMFV